MLQALIRDCQRMIAIPSESGREGEAAAFLQNVMLRLGYDQAACDEFGNTVGIIRGNGRKKVLLEGHLDTVGVEDPSRWSYEPYAGRIDQGRIYGRGATDMKAALMAMAYAAAAFVQTKEQLDGDIIVAGVVQEEIFEGVAQGKILDRIGPDLVILGEATDLKLCIGQRGRAEVQLITSGKSAHSANPSAGINAVGLMRRLLAAMDGIVLPTDPFLGPAIMELTDIRSDPYPGKSVIPDKCTATLDRRLLPGETENSVLGPIQALIDRLAREDRDFRAEVKLVTATEQCYTGTTLSGKRFFPGWLFPETEPFVRAAQAALRGAGFAAPLSHYSFCTDGSQSAGLRRIPTLGFGPSQEELAHIVDEYVMLDQLKGAYDGYICLIKDFLNKPWTRRVRRPDEGECDYHHDKSKEGIVMKILIKDGFIVDGTGSPGFYSDLIVDAGRIVWIGKSPEGTCDREINAAGRVVAPGFIDTHSHSDLEVFVDPYLEPKVRQGITTEIIGQDGVAAAPVGAGEEESCKENLARITGDYETVTWNWRTVDDYCRLLEAQGLGPNLMTLVPHGNIRMALLGLNSRKPDAGELGDMQAILDRDLRAGAAGLSTGLIYPPCSYAATEELISLCEVVASFGKFFVVHQRSEAGGILDSMREVIGVARQSGVKVHFSHFKLCGRMNWVKLEQMEALLDRAREKGIAVSYDLYPYTAGSTTLSVALPPWALEGGAAATLGRLKDGKARAAMARDMQNGLPGWDNLSEFAGFEGIFITSVRTARNQEHIGKSLAQIAALRSRDPFATVFDLLLEEELKVGMYDYYGNEEHAIRFLQRPEANLCTDGLPGGRPHPRIYGAFPRVLGCYVRERKVMTLESAVHKMTGRPASLFNLFDRGIIKEGNRADLVIFNPETVTDTGTYTEPRRFPEGIDQVLINGALVLDHGVHARELTGEVLRWL